MAVTNKDIKYGFMLVFIVSSILTLTVKINNDNFTFYSNRYIAAQDYWYVEYYKTYGTDEWVTLNRKPSLINTFINETESEYNIYRRTPYYGTASNKGTAGVLYSSWSFNKKPQSIEDFPTSYNTRFVPNLGLTTKPRTYRLIWKIDKIEKEGLESGYITDIDNILWEFNIKLKVDESKIDTVYYDKDKERLLITFLPNNLDLDINIFDPANEITNCMTLDENYGTYYLTQDIITTKNYDKCMNITANHVTLDCQGYTILGDDRVGEIGIYINNVDNTTIKDCIIMGYSDGGIYVSNSNDNNITGTTIASKYVNITDCSTLDMNYRTYYLTQDIIDSSTFNCMHITADHIILDCQGHTIDGIDGANSYGICLDAVENTTLQNCIITDWKYGIYSYDSEDNIITNITESSCTNIGLYLRYGRGTTVENSTFNNNIVGIYIDYDNDNFISNVTLSGNSHYGIGLRSRVANINVTDSYIYNNTDAGISFDEFAGNHPTNCYVYNNLFNNTVNYIDDHSPTTLYFNTTQQIGTRIYSSGTQIGGNYWAYPNGTGYSETCSKSSNGLDNGMFCNQYVVDTGVYDYLPLTEQLMNIYSPDDSTIYTNRTIDIKWSLNENLSSMKYNLNGGSNSTLLKWQTDNSIKSGLSDIGRWSTPDVFYKDGTYYLLSGEYDANINGYNWTGSVWQVDATIKSGLGTIEQSGYEPVLTVFNMSGTWYLIAGVFDAPSSGKYYGFNWSGTTWQDDNSIISGLPVPEVRYPAPDVFYMDGTWYLITGNLYGLCYGYNWTGSAWQLYGSGWFDKNDGISKGLPDLGASTKPRIFERYGTWYNIIGEEDGIFNGYEWYNNQWNINNDIVYNLGDIGTFSAPSVFNISNDWYIISGEDSGNFFGFNYTGYNTTLSTNINGSNNIIFYANIRNTYTEILDFDFTTHITPPQWTNRTYTSLIINETNQTITINVTSGSGLTSISSVDVEYNGVNYTGTNISNMWTMSYNMTTIGNITNTIWMTDSSGNINPTTFTYNGADINITYFNSSEQYMIPNATGYTGMYPMEHQPPITIFYNNGNGSNIYVNVTINTSVNSCLEFYLNNETLSTNSVRYQADKFTSPTTTSTVVESMSNSSNVTIYGWCRFINCVSGSSYYYDYWFDFYNV